MGAHVSVLGVRFLDMTMAEALELLARQLQADATQPARAVYFVNAATLNLASEDRAYRDILNQGDYVFGDGTGVRWGARMLGARLQDNVNGTDLVPRLATFAAGRGHRYFLLGATPDAIARAAAEAVHLFPGWIQAGFHHGYLNQGPGSLNGQVIEAVNAAQPDLLLVGMGNPLQETWLHRHRSQLRVRLCMGVGGLFTYWARDLRRAAPWVRRLGQEWVHLLISQPHKARRYLLGNPRFLMRVAREKFFGLPQ
jgi:N-acetylglucosaminyldiphosphoundecaprenol N-acetyl-beta-D-mannosaminyltransferase